MLCITNGIVRAEVHLEFQNKLGVAVHPEEMKSRGFREEEVRFKPFLSHALGVWLGKNDLGVVNSKGS